MIRKSLKTILLAAAAVLLLTACGGKKQSVSVDVQKLADDLSNQCVTSDTLTATAEQMIPTIYYVSEDALEKGAAYMSAGSTACEVAVIQCKEESQTKDVREKFAQRVKSQAELYASYAPEQVEKLEQAIIKDNGVYAVLVVCDDTDKANELLKNSGF